MAKNSSRVGPRYPQVLVLVGGTGDLSKRKLLPGLFHLASAGFIPGCRIIGLSLDDIDADGFRTLARGAIDQFSHRKVNEADYRFVKCAGPSTQDTARVPGGQAMAQTAAR